MVSRLVFAVLIAAHACSAFYLPGVAPHVFRRGETLNPKVTSLTSTENQLTFDYYSLPFCRPESVIEYPENLGEALLGEKALSSAYEFTVMEDTSCQVLCRKVLDADQVQELQDFAVLNYRGNMRLDNLPVAQVMSVGGEEEGWEYALGYPIATAELAEVDPEHPEHDAAHFDHYTLYNHLHFTILYHAVDNDPNTQDKEEAVQGVYIVGFRVEPRSISHHYEEEEWNDKCMPNHCRLTTCPGPASADTPLNVKIGDDKDVKLEVIFTYDVSWEMSAVKWASRWDVYLEMKNDQIHWFNIVNSLIVVLFLTGTVGLIMMRILRKDIAMYNEVAQDEEALREEYGWKLVYGDVFRPPPYPRVLGVLVGSGLQVFVMTTLTLAWAMLGFLSPSNRGSLMSAVIFFFVLLGACAGYTSARYCKYFKDTNQFATTLTTALAFPGVVFAVFMILDVFLWAKESASAVPFGTLLALCCLWFGVSVPLVFLGSYFGFKKEVFQVPVRTNAIPRKVPDLPFYLQPLTASLAAGVLPFGVVFVEMSFILASIWQHRFYYLFGFLFLVFVMCMVTIAEVSLVICYFHLCYEDYRWWWRSYFSGGSVSLYMLIFTVYQYVRHAQPTLLSAFIYFGYMLIFNYAVFIMCAFVSFHACFYFVRTIYGAIKVD